MGSGKTTVGTILAKLTGWNFIDSDDLIVQTAGASCSDIIQSKGEAYFRQLERKIIRSVVTTPPLIIATGGGLPCYQDNMHFINQMGTTIFLNRTAEDLALRLELTDISTRPMLQGKTGQALIDHIHQQLQTRLPYYQLAHYTIDGHGDDDAQIAAQIYQLLTTHAT